MALALVVLTSAATAQSDPAVQRADEYTAAARRYEVAASGSASSELLLRAAKAWVNAHEYKAAESDLDLYLKSHPESDDAQYLMAFVYFRENRPKESLAQATRAAALRDPSADDLKIVALDYSLLGDLASADKYLQLAIGKDPRNREALYHLGRIRYIENHFSDAIGFFSRVLAIDPGDVKALTNLGLAYEGEGKSTAAIEAYDRAIQVQTSAARPSERPFYELGRLLLTQDKAANATPILARAVEINGGCAECLLELGKCEIALGAFSEARSHLEKSVSLDDTSVAAHYTLARLYKRMNLTQLAQRELARTEELNRKRLKAHEK
ncbi:MAG: hypothetical protein NVS9B15_22390 [Acidobacteriaceae bacterium]